MFPTPIHVAILGYGYSSRTFHVPLISATPGLEIAAVVSSQPEKVHADHPRLVVMPAPAEAIARADVDLVIVATPNETHAPLALAALAAGKHVVVEKPFTLTVAEARAVAVRAREAKRVCAVFQNRRWDSDFLAARALIASGVAGEITHFESHYDRYRPQVRNRWREQPGPGGGLWRDLGPHLVDQALVLFGTPSRVLADFALQRPGAKVDDWCHVVFDYGARRVILHAGSHVSGRWPRMVMHGPGGSWVKFGLDVQERQLLAGLAPDDASFGVDDETATWFDGGSGEPVPMAVPRGDYRQFYLRVRDAINGAGPNPVPPEEGIRVIETIDAAIESAAMGRAVAV